MKTITLLTVLAINAATVLAQVVGNTRTQNFDRDPNWDGHNNRATKPEPMQVRQDFGYSATAHAGGKKGEIGGFMTPAAEPSYYAKVIPDQGFDDTLTASGQFRIAKGGGHILITFFNSATANEWRTADTFALRIGGEGDVFNAYLEYGTSKWRAGGILFTTDNPAPGDPRMLFQFPTGDVTHTWSIKFDPKGNNGAAVFTATIDDQTVTTGFRTGHEADGATFNRFGLLNMMRHADSRSGTIWIDDLRINGKEESFDSDPKWEGFQNRRTYTTTYVRPRFDFGFSPTHFAGGKAPGEMGGLIFRGNQQIPEQLAYFGDRLEHLTLERPLYASGKISLKQAVTDCMGLIGFFHSTDSIKTGSAQVSIAPENFLGFAVEGPSDQGFYVYPYYGSSRPDQPPQTSYRQQGERQHIYPDGKSHDWTLLYLPADADGNARITVTLDGKPYSIALPAEDKAAGAHFNRFGMITTHVDGNGLKMYFDDLTYTFRQ
jgi:hypothetical protein